MTDSPELRPFLPGNSIAQTLRAHTKEDLVSCGFLRWLSIPRLCGLGWMLHPV